ncbi:MAG: outer membrane beta-barrel protein [Candidatus Eiseniibacteriota bacterium]
MSVGLAVNADANNNPLSLTVFGGMATPTGDLGDAWNSGFSLGGSVQYDTNDWMALEFVAAGDQHFGLNDGGFTGVDGGALNVFSLTGGVRVGAIDRDVYPYAAFGAGYYRVGIGDMEVTVPGVGTVSTSGYSDNVFGFNFGGGIQKRMTPSMSLFGELRYHVAMTEGSSIKYLPIHAGMHVNW